MNKQRLFQCLPKRLFSKTWIMQPASRITYWRVKNPTSFELHGFYHHYYNARKFSTGEETQLTCWNCKSVVMRNTLFCANCQLLQEPNDKVNYFELFDHPQQFDIEMSKVTKCYRELQTRLHPDKFTGMTEKEQKLSGQFSALVNKAYKTLSNRMERGLYLLELYDKSLVENTVHVEPEFLIDIMETNEKLAAVNDVRVLEEIGMNNMVTINALFKQVSKAFQNSDIEKARILLARLKYYYSIDEQILKAEERLGLG